jgi:CheY-like chemotaxis protein
MEDHYPHKPLEDSPQLEEALRQAVEHEQAYKDLQAVNQALQKQIAERTAQLQTVVTEVCCAEQRERYRLAQLLHDDLQPWLTGARQAAEHLGDVRAPVSASAGDSSLHELRDMLDRSLQSLQAFAAQLSPPILYRGSLAEVLEWLAGWMWQEHDFAVQVDADPAANPQAEELRILLFHVVRELLDNVRKHAGTRTARVTLAQADPDGIQITVTDTGIGFDPAVKLGQGRFGTGLTLSTLRRRMELLGGRMDIHSEPGEGTQVTLLSPRRLAHMRPQLAAESPPQPAKPARDEQAGRIRVLLADDHAVVRDGLAGLLRDQPDMDVVGTAANGLEAVDMALQLRPEVIVMDANMPLLSGVQAAKRILMQLPASKVIALSMYSVADMDLAMRQAGACEYLTKETAPEELVATIRRHAPAGTADNVTM